ncbi:unnamed protein product [Larinioides sclopetarius]|uniref:Uncharacterized protein n=1 Tax=Larinioides sclopetarius TaxID=280406 RepID=A0AAV2B781_9ARAC
MKRKRNISEKESKKGQKSNTKAANKSGKEVKTRKTNDEVADKKKTAAKALKPKRNNASKRANGTNV